MCITRHSTNDYICLQMMIRGGREMNSKLWIVEHRKKIEFYGERRIGCKRYQDEKLEGM